MYESVVAVIWTNRHVFWACRSILDVPIDSSQDLGQHGSGGRSAGHGVGQLHQGTSPLHPHVPPHNYIRRPFRLFLQITKFWHRPLALAVIKSCADGGNYIVPMLTDFVVTDSYYYRRVYQTCCIQFCCSFQLRAIFSYRVVTRSLDDRSKWRYVYFVTSTTEIILKMASLDHDVEYAVGFCGLKRTWFAASDVAGVLADQRWRPHSNATYI